MTSRGDVGAAIDRAFSFLELEQLETGRFPAEYTVSAGVEQLAGAAGRHAENTPFMTALVASSLRSSGDARASSMIERAIRFFEREEGPRGLWRFWCKDASLYLQIPPDVDDTSCISALIRDVRGSAPDNIGLLLANRSRNGLFYTWFAPRVRDPRSFPWRTIVGDVNYRRLFEFWNAGAGRYDIDSIVNANVLLYLGKRSETESAALWLASIAQNGGEAASDRWYRSAATFYHAASKCCEAGLLEPPVFARGLLNWLRANDWRALHILDQAMILCALRRLGCEPEAQMKLSISLLHNQQSDGGWSSHPVFFDGRPHPLIWWGSRAVTTGYCIEALALASEVRS